MFGKWAQVQTYGKANPPGYQEKSSINLTKYQDPPLVRTGVGPQISKYIRSKGAEEKESPLLKDNFVCLPK